MSLPPPLDDTLATEDSSDDEYDPEAEDSEYEEDEDEEEEKREEMVLGEGETQNCETNEGTIYILVALFLSMLAKLQYI